MCTRLTGPPAPRPTHLIREEQLQGRIDRSSAYIRDYAVDQFNQIGTVAEEAMQSRGMPAHGKSAFQRIQDMIKSDAQKLSCGRARRRCRWRK